MCVDRQGRGLWRDSAHRLVQLLPCRAPASSGALTSSADLGIVGGGSADKGTSASGRRERRYPCCLGARCALRSPFLPLLSRWRGAGAVTTARRSKPVCGVTSPP